MGFKCALGIGDKGVRALGYDLMGSGKPSGAGNEAFFVRCYGQEKTNVFATCGLGWERPLILVCNNIIF